MALQLPKTGMAVAHDIGEANDIHPHNKRNVGLRLATLADKIPYGKTHAVVSGPLFKSMTIKGNKAVITFSDIGGGLIAKGGGVLRHFAIAGADQKFVWAKAIIEGNTVVVYSNEVSQPVAVRYAWADNPAGANLANKEGFLAPLFRTDNWEN
jgi:sialate O-acetylesterase